MNKKISDGARSNFSASYTTFGKKFEKLRSLHEIILTHLGSLHEIVTDDFACYQDFQMLLKATTALGSDISNYFESDKSELNSEECMVLRHDMRTHVGGIMGYVELALEDLDGHIDTPVADAFRQVYEICEEILPLVNAIRPFVEFGPQEVSDTTCHPYLHAAEDETSYSSKYSDCRVVIIDDSIFTRDILARRLQSMGVKVTSYDNGIDGLEGIRKFGADLILLDVVMPDLDGLEILRELKEDAKTKNIAVIMVSSLSEVKIIVNCIEAGAEDYIPSPFNPSILRARVAASLDKRLMGEYQTRWVEEVSRSKKILQTAIESMDECFAMFSEGGEIVICNNHFQDLYPFARKMNGTGFTLEELLRENYAMGVYFVERRTAGEESQELKFETWLQKRLEAHKNYEAYEEHLCDGRWLEITTQDTPDGGFVTVHKNVTQRHKDQERMQFLAHHDPLTGLLNRLAFGKELQKFTERAKEDKLLMAVLFLDLDGFKQVNDELGHEAGDQVLIYVANKLKAVVRNGDPVARLGGDEFAIILTNLESIENVEVIAQRIIKEVGNTVDFEGTNATFGVSIGGAIYSKAINSADNLLKLADEAMYDVKKAGKGAYKIAANE